MSRLVTAPTVDAAPSASQPLLAAVQKKLGSVPNMFRAIASTPAGLEGYLGLEGALGKDSLGARTRERIALAVAEVNQCGYCLAAHAYLGRNLAKLDEAEIARNRGGGSADAKAAAAVRFAVQVALRRGQVTDAELAAVQAAGFDDGAVVEIVLHVALNTLTNYVNLVAGTDIDFPQVESLRRPDRGGPGGLCPPLTPPLALGAVMTTPARPSSDVAFSDRVKAEQSRRGSRAAYARLERRGGFETELDDDLAGFVASQRSAFLATASAGGQPYVQHRGGPAGFLKVLDPHTIAFADFAGNRQYVSLGNLAENPKVLLFLIDYQLRQRVKIWGEARVVEDDPALLARLMPAGYAAKPERAIVIRVTAWDANCPQHIPQRLEAGDVEAALAARDARIASLEAEVRALRTLASLPGTA